MNVPDFTFCILHSNPTAMLANYFRIALRHLQKNKLYALVNISGLAIGIASCLLIGIYIVHEWNFDRFHKNADRIGRIIWHYNFSDAITKTASTGTKAGPEFARRFPEVEHYTRLLKYPRVIKKGNELYEEKNFLYADAAFFKMFSFDLLKGDRNTVLDAPDKLVLSATTAKKYFGNEDPMGKIVTVGGTKEFIITGIVKDAPENSQIQYDLIGSFTSLNASKTEKWNEANYITYVMTRNAGQLQPLQPKIDALLEQVAKEEQWPANQFSRYIVEPLTRVHLHSDLDGFEPNNNIVYIYILAVIALLILVIACVNYTNLNIAQSAARIGEISMRKVMGAAKSQVFIQFITESLCLILIAFLFAMALSWLLLPAFNELAGKHFTGSILLNPFVLIGLLTGSLLVTFTAGAYPAILLSNTRMMALLKSGFRFTGSGMLRKGLIVVQFVIATFLIITTAVILQQLNYIRTKNIGYTREQVVVLPVDRQILEKYDDIKSAFKTIPSVQSVGGAYEEPTHIGWSDGLHAYEGDKEISINALPADEDLISTLNMQIIAGTGFNRTDVLQFDTSDDGRNIRYSFVLNEAAVKALGWKPEEAIGKKVAKGFDGTVKGVVKDFHFRTLHEPINPLAIFLDKRMLLTMFIRIKGDNVQQSLADLEKTWKQRITHRPFEYHFLDEDYQSMYKTEQRTAGVFTTFSTIAIVLACLGLFALTAYTMVQRTKEIGIRKVLGASLAQILTLVSTDFIKLVAIAFLIALPLAWYAVSEWLNNFTYRINLQWWVFVASGFLTVAIAFITISLQAMRTASENPVKNLRTE